MDSPQWRHGRKVSALSCQKSMADNSSKKIFRTHLVKTEIHPFLKRTASLHSLNQNLDGHNQVVKKHNVKHKQLSLCSFHSINNAKPTKNKVLITLWSCLRNCCNLTDATYIAAPNFNVQRFPRPYFLGAGGARLMVLLLSEPPNHRKPRKLVKMVPYKT